MKTESICNLCIHKEYNEEFIVAQMKKELYSDELLVKEIKITALSGIENFFFKKKRRGLGKRSYCPFDLVFRAMKISGVGVRIKDCKYFDVKPLKVPAR